MSAVRAGSVSDGKDVYLSAFSAFEKRLIQDRRAGFPARLQKLRRAALSRFAALGFPTLEDEEWRFTNLAGMVKVPFEPGIEDGQGRRVSYQGPRLPEGVLVCSLAEGLARRPDLVEPHLAHHADYEKHAFTALNTTFLHDGTFVHVPAGKVIEQPIELAFHAHESAMPLVWHRRNLIVLGANSQATIVENYTGDEGVYFTNAVTEVVAGDSSVLDYYRVQRESKSAFHVATVQVHQERGSRFTSGAFARGAALARTDLNVVLNGEGCDCTLNGLYLGAGEQLVDNHTRIDHAKPRCTSHELYKGLLDGRSRGVFNGKIYVHRDAQKTDARQTNKTLLLSGDAQIDTKPQLEIYADDVKCTHGATIGQLDEEQVFYLRARGIDRASARRLLTYAFANDIISRIRIERFRAELEEAVKETP